MMSQLFSEVSEQQQEQVSGGIAVSMPISMMPAEPWGGPPSMSLPTESGPAYPLPASDPRHAGSGCPGCGMG